MVLLLTVDGGRAPLARLVRHQPLKARPCRRPGVDVGAEGDQCVHAAEEDGAEEDLNYYETGTKVSDEELAAVPLLRHKFHGDWNYTIAQSDSR